jgi:hypothetical protein
VIVVQPKIPRLGLTFSVQLNMKTNQSSSTANRFVRSTAGAHEQAPFREGDVVEYVAVPSRRFIVAHCYLRKMAGGEGDCGKRPWIVAEVNANTHLAEELRLVSPL